MNVGKKTAALALSLGLAVGLSTVGAHMAYAGGGWGGTAPLCSLKNLSVTADAQQHAYAYEVDCSGNPLSWFGGNATARYQVFGTWNLQSNTAHDDVFSIERNEAVLDTWVCTSDPWTTAGSCVQQSRRGGDDWETIYGDPFASSMCSNEPWGACLANGWSAGSLGPDGPNVTLVAALVTAEAQSQLHGAPTPPPSPSPLPFPAPIHPPIHLPG
jgi:hypothetical protein